MRSMNRRQLFGAALGLALAPAPAPPVEVFQFVAGLMKKRQLTWIYPNGTTKTIVIPPPGTRNKSGVLVRYRTIRSRA